MKMDEELQIVVSTYAGVKDRMWSKTAKKILGIHLFGNSMLTSGWDGTFRRWLDEIRVVQGRSGPIPMLMGPRDTIDDFLQSLVKDLHSRGHLTREELTALSCHDRSVPTGVIKPLAPYAQAILVKAFFEASLCRPGGWDGFRTKISVYSEEFFTKPLGSMLEGREEDAQDLERRRMERYGKVRKG